MNGFFRKYFVVFYFLSIPFGSFFLSLPLNAKIETKVVSGKPALVLKKLAPIVKPVAAKLVLKAQAPAAKPAAKPVRKAQTPAAKPAAKPVPKAQAPVAKPVPKAPTSVIKTTSAPKNSPKTQLKAEALKKQQAEAKAKADAAAKAEALKKQAESKAKADAAAKAEVLKKQAEAREKADAAAKAEVLKKQAEAKAKADAAAKAEAERLRVEAERARVEVARVAAERARQQQAAEAARKVEAERLRVAAEHAAEVERLRVEAERARVEAARVAAERVRLLAVAAEVERLRVAAERAAEVERLRVEAERAAEVERLRVEAERARVEAARVAAERVRLLAVAAEAERLRVAAERAAEVERVRQQQAEAERIRLAALTLAPEPELMVQIQQKIALNPNYNDYRGMGLTNLFAQGCYGQGVTVAVIEAGFYHTLAPQDRNDRGNVAITPSVYDWYSDHKDQILPPLAFYDPYLSPLNDRFEAAIRAQIGFRGKDFRFRHGDEVLSTLAEAAPLAKVLPVMAAFGPEDGSFIRALEALSDRDDVNIINISRWLQSTLHDETQLDPSVLTALRKCADKGKILVLSAGNTFEPIPTVPTRNHYKIRDVSSFVANLISDLFHNLGANDSLRTHTVISGALHNATDWIANYSVTAGHGPASNNYVATKGSNYCSIFGEIWRGTSTSSPYTAASLANLLSARKGIAGSRAVKAIFDSADSMHRAPHIYGRGVQRADNAFEELLI